MKKAPEPTESDIATANSATARQIFDGSNGAVTVAYYRRLQSLGPIGIVAMNLFRAQKTSSRAKHYRGRFRRASYDVKNYSLTQLCEALKTSQLEWGWQHDPGTPGYEWVLYVDLPQGQCSFHSPMRLCSRDYPGKWDSTRASEQRILEFCDSLCK